MSTIQEREREEPLLRLAEAISDEVDVAWETEKRLHPGLSDSIERLRVVEALVRASRAPVDDSLAITSPMPTSPGPAARAAPGRGVQPAGEPALGSWGPLRVLEKIGEGGFAEVYRAHDPVLDCDVALKLWRAESGETQEQLLAEARRLARVRHENVLVVHGADRHEGRAGMWTDLVRGETLEARLARHGRFGACEAATIGIELCRALAAMHGAGLVHRDVKTFNVMRTEHGRIVLMDFGCVGEISPDGDLARTTSVRGTPITMSPEQLAGGVLGPATDIYGLGVLLYRLVSGEYPVEAVSYHELVEKHRARAATPLLDRRPDLPAAFVSVVERALAPDSTRRHATAGALEQALHEALMEMLPAPDTRTTSGLAEAGSLPGRGLASERIPVPPSRPWWRRTAVRLAGAAALALMVVSPFVAKYIVGGARPGRASETPIGPAPPGGPSRTRTGSAPEATGPATVSNPPVATTAPPAVSTTFNVEARLFRVGPAGDERLLPGARIGPGDALFLEIESPETMYAYVLNEDANGKFFVLYPLAGFDTSNPLKAGRVHRLPGTRAGKTVDWEVTSAGRHERVVVIASRHALPDLEQEVAGFPQPVAGEPVAYGEVSEPTATRLRGIGGLKEGRPASGETPGTQLGTVLRNLPGGSAAPRDPWVWQVELENPKR